MIIKTNFRSGDNNKEILPMDTKNLPYVCMYTTLDYNNKFFPWHWHTAFEIDYIVDGQTEFYTADKTVSLQAGDVLFINSGILHAYKSIGTANCHIQAHLFTIPFLSGMYSNILEKKYISPIAKSSELSAYKISADTFKRQYMIDNIVKMAELAKIETFGYEFEIRSELSEFWCGLISETANIRNLKSTNHNTDIDRIKSMMQFIHENYSEKLTLDKIAKSGNISKRECTRCFARCIDNSPINYLNDYRIQMAAQMLLETKESVMTISEGCGFSTNSYFGKVFLETMGMTPMAYRKAESKSHS